MEVARRFAWLISWAVGEHKMPYLLSRLRLGRRPRRSMALQGLIVCSFRCRRVSSLLTKDSTRPTLLDSTPSNDTPKSTPVFSSCTMVACNS